MNNATMIGNLCRDFEVKGTDGNTFATNAIAVKSSRKDKDGNYPSYFFDITVFGKQSDYAVQYCRKGDKVCVSGEVRTREYTNKENVKVTRVEIAVNSIENLTPKQNNVVSEEELTGDNLDSIDIPDDDLPF